ncbi:hypothetical protein T484DRAFT_1646195, partial [Baffinella frigidus]
MNNITGFEYESDIWNAGSHPLGYYVHEDVCTECDDDMFAPTTGTSPCTKCRLNSNTWVGGRTVCTCGFGYTGPDDGECVPCEAGTYKNYIGDASYCKCLAGYTGVDGDACIPCDAGYYKQGAGNTECTQCPTSRSSLPGSDSVEACVCPVGFTGEAAGVHGMCTACSAGSFKSVVGGTPCKPCPAGKYQAMGGAVSCLPCPDGSTSVEGSGVCATCPEGTYSYTGSQTACTLCAAGRWSEAGAAVCVTDCPVGTGSSASSLRECHDCSAGTEKGFAGEGICVDCPVNTYASKRSASCTACPTDTVSYGDGGPESCHPECPGVCIACNGTLASCTCLAGYTGDDGVACTECGAGTWKSATGSASCTSCDANT